jgi:hypothetical protein
VHVLDDSVMRDATIETRDLHISILHAGASRLCVSHVVHLYLTRTCSLYGGNTLNHILETFMVIRSPSPQYIASILPWPQAP